MIRPQSGIFAILERLKVVGECLGDNVLIKYDTHVTLRPYSITSREGLCSRLLAGSLVVVD